MHGCAHCHLHPSQPLCLGGTLAMHTVVWGALITSSAIPGGTQIVAAPPNSLRAGHFPSPCPGFPAFESASPQNYPFINNPAGVPLCTVPFSVPTAFTTSLCPCHGRDLVSGQHHWQDKICPPVGSSQLGCTCTLWGWGRAGAPGGQSSPSCLLAQSWCLPLPRSNLSPHVL